MQLFTHLLSSYLQGMGDFFSALPRGRSFNCWPIPAFFKGMELQRKPHPSLPKGRSTNCWPIPAFFKVKGFQQKPLPTFHMGKERHPSALNTAG